MHIYKRKIMLLWVLHIVVPSMCAIWTEMVLNSCSWFSISICKEVIRVATCCLLIHAKICFLREMIIILLEHWYLVRKQNMYIKMQHYTLHLHKSRQENSKMVSFMIIHRYSDSSMNSNWPELVVFFLSIVMI